MFKRIVFLILVLSFIPMSAVAEGYKRSDIKIFTRMVFSNGNSGAGIDRMQKPCLQKWGNKIDVSIVGDIAESQRKIAVEAIEYIAGLANISYTLGSVNNSPNASSRLNLKIVDIAGVNDRSYKSKCSASRTIDPQCKITSAVVTIPRNIDDGQFRYCMYHETLHGFGFQGHVWNKSSILNPRLYETSLTPWDIRALKTIYRNDLPSGSTIPQTISKLKASK